MMNFVNIENQEQIKTILNNLSNAIFPDSWEASLLVVGNFADNAFRHLLKCFAIPHTLSS